ncbi:cysteine desulfurase family protein [Fulvivirga sedimenti]|uniref:Cysteine desulfurase n=1 Tax=Fulvivirga sedimenti TaxID=2879465 RepID=A0A9X1HWY8_9BACT|nr:cysteine desulfurase family protein [Fulvivirga sedimenti]MCA6078297.1 cysteine desulfurase [Fulvivirga sedimenti]
MSIYLDNAATTPIDPAVFAEMEPYLKNFYGNPSSIHAIGREAKAALETSRKTVAGLLNASPMEIYFTSGGTEADNTFLWSAARAFGIRHAITSPVEHHAVLHTLGYMEDLGLLQVHYVKIDESGRIDFEDLKRLLSAYPSSLVSLMHGNNEIGNLLDLEQAGTLCREAGAIFHSDTVQTVGHFPLDLQVLQVDGIAASAHKFHGPKGVGFMYVNKNRKIDAYIHGGSQERNMRGGTENVAGIVGLTKALELAVHHMEQDSNYILSLKGRMISQLKDAVEGVEFNGLSAEAGQSLYTVLNVSLPPSDKNDMLLFHLDLNGICASGGSACASGATTGSHVLSAIGKQEERGAVRFSFSKFNTTEDVDRAAAVLKEFYQN